MGVHDVEGVVGEVERVGVAHPELDVRHAFALREAVRPLHDVGRGVDADDRCRAAPGGRGRSRSCPGRCPRRGSRTLGEVRHQVGRGVVDRAPACDAQHALVVAVGVCVAGACSGRRAYPEPMVAQPPMAAGLGWSDGRRVESVPRTESAAVRLPLFADYPAEHFRQAFERGMARAARRGRGDRDGCGGADVREHDAPARAQRASAATRAAGVFVNTSSADSNEAIDGARGGVRTAASLPITTPSASTRRCYARIADLHARARRPRARCGVAYLLERYHRELTLAGAGLDESETRRACASSTSSLDAHDEVREEPARRHERARGAPRRRGRARRSRAGRSRRPRSRGCAHGASTASCSPSSSRPASRRWRRCRTRAVRERLLRRPGPAASAAASTTTGRRSLEITRLRAERARLLGFADHAAGVTADETAGTPGGVAAAARAARAGRRPRTPGRAGRPAGDRGPRRAARRPTAWDWALLTEQVRAERFDVDLAAMRPVLRGRAGAARRRLLRGRAALRASGSPSAPTSSRYHPDVRVFEVTEETASPSGSTCSTCTRATRSAAARG